MLLIHHFGSDGNLLMATVHHWDSHLVLSAF